MRNKYTIWVAVNVRLLSTNWVTESATNDNFPASSEALPVSLKLFSLNRIIVTKL